MSTTSRRIELRYRRIIRLMMWAACLSSGEAHAAIRDHKSGLSWSGEAVNHYGGIRPLLDTVLRLRTDYRLREMLTAPYWSSPEYRRFRTALDG